MNNMNWQTTGQLAGLLGAIKIAHLGTQNHKFDLFVLWALAFAVLGLGLSSSVTLGKVRGFLALRKSLGCLFDPSPLDMSIAQGS
jgi:hypothetical protein